MKTIQKLYGLALCLLACISLTSAQLEQPTYCGMPQASAIYGSMVGQQTTSLNGQQSILTTQIGGKWMKTRDTLNVLIVFVQFPDDQYDPAYPLWPVNQPPTFLNTYIDSLPSQQSTNGNLTHYFRQMSLGAFALTGKTRFVITPHTRQWYSSNNWERWVINKEVLETLDGSLDFSEFDRWKRYGPYDIRREADGWVDIIFMIYRSVEGMGMGFYGGEASLGYARTWSPYNEPTEFTVDGGARRIGHGHPVNGGPGSGTTSVIAGAGDGWYGFVPYRVQIHEFSHYWMTDGDDFGHNGDGFWGMLNAWGARYNTQNASVPNSFERELVGWIAPDSIAQTTYGVTLTDYITTGDAVKVKVPGTNPNEVFRLEYHGRASSFDCPDMSDPNAKGLYVIHQTGMTNPYDQLRLEPADGRWTWVSDEVVYPGYYSSGLAVYERAGIDRVNGYDDSRSVPFTWIGPPPTPSVPNPMLIHPYRDRTKSTYPLIEPGPTIFRGDGKDAFTLARNNILTPWSNPNSQNEAKQATGVAIEIASEDPINHVIVVNIYFDSTLARSLVPSKAQDVQASFNPSNQAVIGWSPNIESDVTTGGGYDLYRATYWGSTLTYTKINAQLLTSASFTDAPPVPTDAPVGVDVWYRYHVVTKDNQGKYSVPSDDFWLYAGKTVSGTIVSTTWSGRCLVIGDATISTGQALTVNSGTVVKFASAKSLAVNGTLSAQGSSSSPITFDRAGTSGTWGGLIIKPSGRGNLTYCTIQNATYGVKYEGQNDPNVQNCTIANCTYGIYASSYYGGTIAGNMISNTSTGIYLYNISPTVSSNTLTYNTSGIYCDTYSSPLVYGNTISHCTGTAITCRSNASPQLKDPCNGPGNNLLQSNGLGVYADYGATPFLGSSSAGASNIVEFTSGAHIQAMYTGAIWAQYNWWDPLAANKFSASYGATIYYLPALDQRPGGGLMAGGSGESEVASGASNAPKDLEAAVDFKAAGDCGKALEMYKAIFERELDTPLGRYALCEIGDCYLMLKLPGFDEYASGVMGDLSKYPALYAVRLALNNKALMSEGMYDQVLENLECLSSDARYAVEVRKTNLYDIGLLYLNAYEDYAKAKEIFGEFQAKYPDDKLNEDAQLLLRAGQPAGSGSDPMIAKNMQITQPLPVVPDKYELFEAYPNPFNPSTTLRYALPEAGFMTLRVCDLLGREVTSLVDGYSEAGYHEVVWNAVSVSSGVYLARFMASDALGKAKYMKVTKLLLMK